MHKKPLTLTIVIPVYNEELYLPSCLEAVAAQTLAPDAVIVVNNNSTDTSKEIARRYPLVRVVDEPKTGVIFARDKGFDSAKTDIIARIDADTIISPRWVERLHHIFADSDVAAATGAVGLYDAPFSSFNHIIDHVMRKYIYLFGTRHNKPFLSGPNMAIRRSTWDKVRLTVCRDRLIHEDIDLAIHIATARGKVVYDDKLKASVSTRRYNDKLPNFRKYMQMFGYTYRRHNLHGLRVQSASTMYWLGYFLIHPLRKPTAWLRKVVGGSLPYDTAPRKSPN